MKRLLILVLIAAMLSGCSLLSDFVETAPVATQPVVNPTPSWPAAPETTLPVQTTVPVQTTEPVPETTLPVSGWMEDDGGRYYLDDNGHRVTGWLEKNGQRYYLDESGYCLTGWQTLDSKEYYFQPDGSMAKGAVIIDGVTRHFTGEGDYIVLVNPWNAVPEDYELDLVELGSDVAVGGSYVQSSCKDAMTRMIRDCNQLSGSNVCVVSAYRSYSLQESNFNNKVQYYINQGYSQEAAYATAATIIAVPGTSEHHLGLAADIIDTRIWDLVEEQETLTGQQWLMAHCHEYGFILRYPKDKTPVTGIIYEPWHYRYVGVELATQLKESGQTLEEYIASLQNG